MAQLEVLFGIEKLGLLIYVSPLMCCNFQRFLGTLVVSKPFYIVLSL